MFPLHYYKGLCVAIYGLGLSGVSAARALAAAGADVVAWDDAEAAREAARFDGVEIAPPDKWRWADFSCLVLSPGVPFTHPAPHAIVKTALDKDVEILGDVELFARVINDLPEDERPKIVAITGTNGKSTTTALIGHMLKYLDEPVHVGGNIGAPVLSLPAPTAGATYVLELSSYQLDLTTSFRANIAVLLNIAADHLERHGGMAGYVAAKRRIFRNQKPGDAAIVGVDDDHSQAIFTKLRTGVFRDATPISSESALSKGVFAVGGRLAANIDGVAQEFLDLTETGVLRGPHNWQNAAAAMAVGLALKLNPEKLAAAVASFPGLAHRQEQVGRLGATLFVNDSKATNTDAAARALTAFADRQIYWIAGGRAKDGGFGDLQPFFEHVKRAYLIGEASDALEAALGEATPAVRCGALREAVAAAMRDAASGGDEAPVVLLSPACASFDQYRNFEERGDAFRDLVRELTNGEAA